MKVGDLVRIKYRTEQDNTVALVLETNPSQHTCATLDINPTVAKLKYCCSKRGVQWTPFEFLEMVNESR